VLEFVCMSRSPWLKTRYHATFELDQSGIWLARVDEIPQVHTFGRTLGKAREYLIDALALWVNQPIEKVKKEIDVSPVVLPEKVQRSLDEAKAARVIAEVATKIAGVRRSDAAWGLMKTARLSVRDAAEFLGVSHQRVQQLVSEERANLANAGGGSQGLAEDIAKSLRKYVADGSRDDLGALAAAVTQGLAIAWTQAPDS
jgi:predicted RNase H-like HicB family nuclease